MDEFVNGTYKHDLNALKAEMALAQSGIEQAERRLERARRARRRLGEMTSKKGAVAASDVMAELDVEDRVDASEQTIAREKASLAQAKSRQYVLEKYTQDKTIKALTLDVERKRSDELAKKSNWRLEQSKANKLETQIASCTITAPAVGAVVYANPPRQRHGETTPPPLIEEGVQVRERQMILSVIDLNGPKQVNTKIPESQIRQFRQGMKAKIRVDAFPMHLLNGTVVEVSPLPDASRTPGAPNGSASTRPKSNSTTPSQACARACRRRSSFSSTGAITCSACLSRQSSVTTGKTMWQ